MAASTALGFLSSESSQPCRDEAGRDETSSGPYHVLGVAWLAWYRFGGSGSLVPALAPITMTMLATAWMNNGQEVTRRTCDGTASNRTARGFKMWVWIESPA